MMAAEGARFWRWHMLAAGILLAGVVLLLSPISAQAEETPITVPLAYVVNYSNYGPTTATGTAEVWRNDAEVRLYVDGLPVLSNQKYQCWLVNQKAGTFLQVGSPFNVSSNGSAVVDVALHGSLSSDYNMVLITIQPDPDITPGTPSKKYSIAGYYQGNSAVQQQVQHLPDTGANAEHPPFEQQQISPGKTVNAENSSPHLLAYGFLGVAICSLVFLILKALRTARG
jgi:hypothetical protein